MVIDEVTKLESSQLLKILNSLDALVYIADTKTYEMIWMNWYGIMIFGNFIDKKCWETIQVGQSSPCEFCSNNKILDKDGNPNDIIFKWEFQNTVTHRWFDCRDQALIWEGRVVRLEIATDITDKIVAKELGNKLIRDLQKALTEVKVLSGLLPMCCSCKKIRDDKGYWKQIEQYIQEHTNAKVSHGICQDCVKKLYPELEKEEEIDPRLL